MTLLINKTFINKTQSNINVNKICTVYVSIKTIKYKKAAFNALCIYH